ncbi:MULTISPECIES: DUF692 domain-containing protein [unclassified Polaromonas]|uniref:MNIO family bufferin maturase n=1 Tax=unclassified Polaromonas TaxID=2638319 RepID=UPI000F078206|nr:MULTISPECIES: DUF692 domain-containing protein [unclassified Polaromonas]AYQ30420.1 DUF692 domain-containing protein [Polaromonas sp. SP1]QGJ17375.1 DUF692 family protein [Polaromonas sp. Pch-P]
MSPSHQAGQPACGIGWRHPHYGELLESLPGLDFIEVHSENFFAEGGAALAVLRQAREHYPVSLHGVGLALGSACGIDAWHLDQLARLVERIEPVRVSDHACFARGAMAGRELHAADLLPVALNNAALDVMCANVQRVQERLKRPLLVENLSAYLHFNSSDRDETAFLRELVRRTGCGLLVDVNNIYVNALNERIAGSDADPVKSCLRWLDQIPPGCVGELHLAGHCDAGDIVIDDHGSRVCADVWQVYRHAQQRFGGVPALVEWDTGIPPLPVLLEEAASARNVTTPVQQEVSA